MWYQLTLSRLWNPTLVTPASCLRSLCAAASVNVFMWLMTPRAVLQPGLQGWEEEVSFLLGGCVHSRVCVRLQWPLPQRTQKRVESSLSPSPSARLTFLPGSPWEGCGMT